MAGVIQVSSGGDQALKPGGATIEVLLKPSGGVTSAGEGPGGGSQTLWCPSLRVLGAGLRSVGDHPPAWDHCLRSTSEERMHVALVLPVRGVTEIATLQKMWNSE